MKKYLLAVALATLVASPALAASQRHIYRSNGNWMADPAFNAYAAAPIQDVVVNGEIVGRDPDANVRLQLRRDTGPAGGD